MRRLHRREVELGQVDAALLGARTSAPVTWCASRNGSPSRRTSQSARSVAVEKPAPAAARSRSGRGVMSAAMPAIAASASISASAASNTCSLSSCMSFE